MLCCASILGAGQVRASGAWAPEAVFETVDTPEPGRLNSYLAGDIGVLRRDYGLLYLWAAQRALRGRPLTANEIAVARTSQLQIGSEEDGFGYWKRKRAAFSEETGTPAAPQIEVFGTLTDGELDTSFLNCSDDAFATATKRLLEHRGRSAAELAWVRDWVLAQDAVFSNCAILGGMDPAPAPGDAPAWLRADRAYQQAAALFYRGDSERAGVAFQAIASDVASPWRGVAAYLVARTWMREALYFTEQGPARIAALQHAAAAVEAGLADPSLRSRHDSLGRLKRRVALLRDPTAAFQAAVARLDAGDAEDDFMQDLDEVRFLRDDVPVAVAARAWLLNVRSDAAPGGYEIALQQWRALGTRDWLLATLIHAPFEDAGTNAALTAVAAIPLDESAAFPLHFERARLLVARNDPTGVVLLDSLLARERLSTSDRNALRRLRFSASPSLVASLAYAVGPIIGLSYENERDLWGDWMRVPEPDASVPVAVKARPNPEGDTDESGQGYRDWEAESWPALRDLRTQPALLPDPAAQLDRWLTARELVQVSAMDGTALTDEVRRQLIGVAWLRAWLLGQEAVLDAATPTFTRFFPAQAAVLAAGVDGVPASGVPTAGAFRAALVLLRLPGVSPHVPSGVGRAMPADAIGLLSLWRWWIDGATAFDSTNSVDRPVFVTAESAAAATAEREGLARIANATQLLGRIVMAYAAAQPADQSVPEALHLLVRATRYGSPDSALSRRAYTLLNKRYPGSAWAKKTPYFY